jgi:hypothetical protein
MMAIFCFYELLLKNFLTKKNNVKNENAASRGGQGKLTYFSWPPLEVRLSFAYFHAASALLTTLTYVNTVKTPPFPQNCAEDLLMSYVPSIMFISPLIKQHLYTTLCILNHLLVTAPTRFGAC